MEFCEKKIYELERDGALYSVMLAYYGSLLYII